MSNIPKIFHFIWIDKTDEGNQIPAVPMENLACLRQWRHHHPDWRFVLWNGHSIRTLIKDRYPFFLPYYDNYRHWICRVDAAKYFILNAYGGVYLDLDIERVRPIDSLLERCQGFNFVLSKEPQINCERAYKNIMNYVPSNAFLCSVPFYPGLAQIVQLLIDHVSMEERHILLATGPPILYKFIEEQGAVFRDVLVLDSQYLFAMEPGDSRETYEQIKNRETCFGIHRFANGWCGS